MQNKTYIAIDLKSFYASVECAQRNLDPLNANLVVADVSRTEKTICLAVSPSLKKYGIPGRARLFEVIEKVKEINMKRIADAPGHRFSGKSIFADELESDPSLELDFVTAIPQMEKYMQLSSEIYSVYMRWFSPDDIHVYSVDEVFIDAAGYLNTYKISPRELTARVINDVLEETGITATAGIGTNLYLCKVAMDIVAKHINPDSNGVRIAELDEQSYREQLWSHTPITDFWRVGKGYAERLARYGIYTMGDIAKCSSGSPGDKFNEELLYKLFGINAELLIDHAWGIETCTMADIKAYRPESNSLSSAQVLKCGYTNEKAGIIIREMAENAALELFEKKLVTNQLVITISYDSENITDRNIKYSGPTEKNHYGRIVPKGVHGSVNLPRYTSSEKTITGSAYALFKEITDADLLIRRISITTNHVICEKDVVNNDNPEQLSLFDDDYNNSEETELAELEKEKKKQQAIIEIKKKFGKNAILKGISYEEGATAKERNEQVGGHRK